MRSSVLVESEFTEIGATKKSPQCWGLKSDYLRAFLSKANGFTGFPLFYYYIPQSVLQMLCYAIMKPTTIEV